MRNVVNICRYMYIRVLIPMYNVWGTCIHGFDNKINYFTVRYKIIKFFERDMTFALPKSRPRCSHRFFFNCSRDNTIKYFFLKKKLPVIGFWSLGHEWLHCGQVQLWMCWCLHEPTRVLWWRLCFLWVLLPSMAAAGVTKHTVKYTWDLGISVRNTWNMMWITCRYL